MKKLYSVLIILILYSFVGVSAVASDDCIQMTISRDTLYVGETFTAFPKNLEIASHFSTGDVDVVSIEGNYTTYKAVSSGTIIFMNCNEVVTVKIFPKESPLDAFLNMIGLRKK